MRKILFRAWIDEIIAHNKILKAEVWLEWDASTCWWSDDLFTVISRVISVKDNKKICSSKKQFKTNKKKLSFCNSLKAASYIVEARYAFIGKKRAIDISFDIMTLISSN